MPSLHLILLTMVRKSELLLARWEHVDLDAAEWHIPAEHSKTGKPHIVYLSTQAVALFKELHALAGGATEVLSIDSSGPALEMARANLAHNPGLDAGRATWLEADVFQHLRTLRAEGRKFDLVVLDPPKFAPSASHAKSAARAYKDINLLGLRLLAPGGLLMTYSCSAGIDPAMFQGIVGDAAADAGVGARVLRRLSAGVVHPVGLAFPEGEYLKGLLIRVA